MFSIIIVLYYHEDYHHIQNTEKIIRQVQLT